MNRYSALIATALAIGCHTKDSCGQPPVVEIHALTMVHKSQRLGPAAVSAVSRRLILTVSSKLSRADSIVTVWTDGEKTDYPDFGLDSIVYSEDSEHFAFAVSDGRLLQYFVDGKPVGQKSSNLGGFSFSLGGQNYTYYVREGDGYKVKESNHDRKDDYFDSIQSLTYSSDGKHVGYMGFDKSSKTSTLVINGKSIASGFTSFPKRLQIGPRSAIIALKRDDQAFLFDGKSILGPFDEIPFYGLSRDGMHSLYVLSNDGNCDAYVDGTKIASFDEVTSMVWADQQSRAYIVGVRGGVHYAYINDVLVGKAAKITDFNPGGTHSYGYLAQGSMPDRTDAWSIVIDDKAVRESDDLLYGLKVSATGKNWACVAADKFKGPSAGYRFIVDGVENGLFSDVTQLQYSIDGTRFVYGAWRDNDYYIITPEKEFGPYDSNGSPPVLSPDGSHFAFFGTCPKGKGIIADGELVLEASGLVSVNNNGPPVFKNSSELNAVVILSEDGVFSNFGQARITWK